LYRYTEAKATAAEAAVAAAAEAAIAAAAEAAAAAAEEAAAAAAAAVDDDPKSPSPSPIARNTTDDSAVLDDLEEEALAGVLGLEEDGVEMQGGRGGQSHARARGGSQSVSPEAQRRGLEDARGGAVQVEYSLP
jgi:hypothetical protein